MANSLSSGIKCADEHMFTDEERDAIYKRPGIVVIDSSYNLIDYTFLKFIGEVIETIELGRRIDYHCTLEDVTITEDGEIIKNIPRKFGLFPFFLGGLKCQPTIQQ